MVYGGVRIGCYAPLKTLFAERRANTAEKGKTPLVEMIAAGASAGAIATVVRETHTHLLLSVSYARYFMCLEGCL